MKKVVTGHRSQVTGARSAHGFTLLEFLIYFAILGFVVAAVTTFMLDVVQTRERVRVMAEGEQNLRFAMQKVLRGVRTATKLNIGASTFGSADGVLSLEMDGPAADPTVFDVADGVLRIAEGAGSPVPLTTPEVEVTKFWLERDDLPGGTKAVTVQLEVSAANPGGDTRFRYVTSASGTAVIRKQR